MVDLLSNKVFTKTCGLLFEDEKKMVFLLYSFYKCLNFGGHKVAWSKTIWQNVAPLKVRIIVLVGGVE